VKTSARTRARELVLQTLYAVECGADEPDERFASIIDDEELSDATVKYARDLLTLARQHADWADGQITELAANWELDRVAKIDRFILRLAMVELKYLVDVPMKVVLNEAIELAKKFSTPQSSSFVNGILDSFAKKQEQAESAD